MLRVTVAFLSHISQIVANRHGWWDFIRDAQPWFSSPMTVTPGRNHHMASSCGIAALAKRRGSIPPHNSGIHSAPLRHSRYTSKNSPRILTVDRSWRSIFLFISGKDTFKQHNDKYLGGSGRSSLPDDILWGMPHEGFGAALKYRLLGGCETTNHSTLVGNFSYVTPQSHPHCWNCRITFSCLLKTVWC